MSTLALQSRPVVIDSTIAAHVANRLYGDVYGVDWIWHHDGIGFLYPSDKPMGPLANIAELSNGAGMFNVNSLMDESLVATSPFVDRIIRIFRYRPNDDTSAIVLHDYARECIRKMGRLQGSPGEDQ